MASSPGAPDKVVGIGEVHANAIGALHIVEVAAIRPGAQRPAISTMCKHTMALA